MFFSKLEIVSDVDFNNAIIEVEGASGAVLLPADNLILSSSDDKQVRARTISVGSKSKVRIPFNKSIFSGGVDFSLSGQLNFTYDDTNLSEGFLDVTGQVDGSVLAKLSGSTGTLSIPEQQIATLRIPVPFGVYDRALRYLGVKVASIMIPIKIGADAIGEYEVGLSINGYVESNLSVEYDKVTKLKLNEPTRSAGFSIQGEVPNTQPNAAAEFKASAGPYVRARPQLLILNQVASIGGDLKVGLYGDGNLTVIPSEPYHCLTVQKVIKSSVSGFFKAVGIDELNTSTINGSYEVGEPYVQGVCEKDYFYEVNLNYGFDTGEITNLTTDYSTQESRLAWTGDDDNGNPICKSETNSYSSNGTFVDTDLNLSLLNNNFCLEPDDISFDFNRDYSDIRDVISDCYTSTASGTTDYTYSNILSLNGGLILSSSYDLDHTCSKEATHSGVIVSKYYTNQNVTVSASLRPTILDLVEAFESDENLQQKSQNASGVVAVSHSAGSSFTFPNHPCPGSSLQTDSSSYSQSIPFDNLINIKLIKRDKNIDGLLPSWCP